MAWLQRMSYSKAGPKVGRMRQLCKGMVIGVVMGVIYCLTMAYYAAEMGVGSNKVWDLGRRRAVDAEFGNWSLGEQERQGVEWLMAVWEASPLLKLRGRGDPVVRDAKRELGGKLSRLAAPHLEHCAALASEHKRIDRRGPDGRRPAWSLWKGRIGALERESIPEMEQGEELLGKETGLVWGPYPPWVEGSDEENLPMTRRAQRDLWLLQHPRNCSDESVRFLVSSWTNNPKHGFGAQIHHIQGMFAVALIDKRVLIMHDFDFANHPGCKGADHRRWSCYFIPETTPECRRRGMELARDENAVASGRVLRDRDIPPHWDIWMAQPSELWGSPWEHSQPTTEIEGKLQIKHNTMNVRWWRAQAIRYMMRYPSEYTCMLMNKARHEAFGFRAAVMALRAATEVQDGDVQQELDMEKWVWKVYKAWVPRPLLSVHVRIGDKEGEMKMVEFPAYMALAERVRRRFPHVQDIWLSTEMQEVIDASKNYTGWNFYYSNVARQTGSTTMAAYLASLGTEQASTMTVVNFLMAAESDFFVGALGSTWCYLIDGMRTTSGKQMAGYLSVNSDRHWR